MAEGFVAMLPSLIGAATQLTTTLISGGRAGGQSSGGTPPFIDPRQAGGKSPFSPSMNPDIIKALISQNNNNEGLSGLGGFTEGSGVPMSDTEQQIPQ